VTRAIRGTQRRLDSFIPHAACKPSETRKLASVSSSCQLQKGRPIQVRRLLDGDEIPLVEHPSGLNAFENRVDQGSRIQGRPSDLSRSHWIEVKSWRGQLLLPSVLVEQGKRAEASHEAE
jgi:hypothetical protein